jgi:hypothetical protein
LSEQHGAIDRVPSIRFSTTTRLVAAITAITFAV